MPSRDIELYLVRHAHAGDPANWSGPDDRRPLSGRGRLQAEALGAHLAALGLTVDAILTSPKVRARETADPIATALSADIRIDERVGSGLTIQTLEAVLADAGDPRRVIVVGHDPDFSELVADLSDGTSVPMKKGALARLDGPRPLRDGGLLLRWLLPPDALPAGSRD